MSFFRRISPLTEGPLRALYVTIALISFAAIGLIFYTLAINSSINSDDCLWYMQNVHGQATYVVARVVPGGNADKGGVKVGDHVIALNGISVVGKNIEKAQKILNSASVDVPIPYLVERNGVLMDLRVPLTRQFLFMQLVLPICAFFWLLIGTIVIIARPAGAVQRRFFLASATMVFPFSFPPQFYQNEGLTVLGILWQLIGLSFFAFWLRFCLAFPVQQTFFRNRRDGVILYIPIILAGAIIVALTLLFKIGTLSPHNSIISIGATAILGLDILYIVAGLVMLYRGYSRMPSGTNRRPMRVILIGTFVFFCTLLYLSIIQASIEGVAFMYPQYLLPSLLILALPISFGYAIFKYQVMDFRMVIRATLVYTSMVVLLAGCYLAIGYGVGQLLGAFVGEEVKATAQVIAFILFVMLFEPVKQRVQRAIENRFFPQRRNYSEQLASYVSVISETVGSVAVAQLMATTLQQVLDLRGVVIALEHSQEGELEPIARACSFEPVEIGDTAIEHLRHLLRANHSGLLPLDTIADPHLAELREWFPYAAGLYAQGRVIGVALLSRPHSNKELSGSETPFIVGVTAQGAAAIEVARLYEEELARQRYREELATARRIQESLLPSRMPDVHGIAIEAVSRPAQTVGGDYYDVIPLSEGRFLVVIADVSGKGLPASLYMAEFHGMVRIASAIHCTPRAILCVLNDHLCEVIAKGSFITSTMLLFDTRNRTVSYARAGHTPIIRRGSTEVDNLIPSGLALGLCPGRMFADALQEYTVRYEPGETFILYSDGVSEAMNGRLEEFGEGRLLDLISASSGSDAESLCGRMLERVEEFRGTAEQNDDITIVVIHVQKDAYDSADGPDAWDTSVVGAGRG